jgi:hypothetical protein
MAGSTRYTLIATILGSSIAFIDMTVVNVALPSIQRDLGGGLAAQQWIVDAYLLTLGSLILVGGSLADILIVHTLMPHPASERRQVNVDYAGGGALRHRAGRARLRFHRAAATRLGQPGRPRLDRSRGRTPRRVRAPEERTPEPMLPLRLFRLRNFAVTNGRRDRRNGDPYR